MCIRKVFKKVREIPTVSLNPYIRSKDHGSSLHEHRRYGKPIELCLRARCANAFYNLSDHVVRRVNHDQKFKGRCDYCNQKYGYDYLIFEIKA